MFRSILGAPAAGLLAAALVCPSPGISQDPSPVRASPGFRFIDRGSLGADAVVGGLVYGPDGRLILYETASAEIRHVDAAGEAPIAKFDPPVFGSFLVIAPDNSAVLFGESTGSDIYRVPFSGEARTVLDHISYAFDLVFDSEARGFVSAPGLLAGNSIRLLDSDPATESKEVVAGLPGFSGPVAVDAQGNLYYGTADGSSATGQAVVRFRKDLLDGAITGDALGPTDGEPIASELGGLYGLRISGGRFFYTDLGFSTGAGGVYLLDPASGFEPMPVATFQLPAGLLSPSFLAFRPGTKDLEPGAGPDAGALAVAFSDFATVNGIGELVAEQYFVRGRVNGDLIVDLSDAVAILGFLFQGGPTPEVRDSADVNDDGNVDLADAVYLLDFLFRGGPSIPGPFPDPGPDA
jgi:hypothetical protein